MQDGVNDVLNEYDIGIVIVGADCVDCCVYDEALANLEQFEYEDGLNFELNDILRDAPRNPLPRRDIILCYISFYTNVLSVHQLDVTVGLKWKNTSVLLLLSQL